MGSISSGIFYILSIVFAVLTVVMAIIAVLVFVRKDIKKVAKELKGLPQDLSDKVPTMVPDSSLATSGEEEEDGADETIALVADENTFNNFKIVKRLVVVANIPDRIV